MADVTVVGSGPSGVHFALTLLSKGHRVRMVDVGTEAPEPLMPETSLVGLKERLDDPVRYFLGEGLEGFVSPRESEEIYGFPPGKSYIFRRPRGFAFEAVGFEPLFSFARGGLAEAWTAGCYPLNRDELVDFPLDYGEMAGAYDEVARRIGVSGAKDDLARFMPVHEHLQEGLPLDEHSARLMARYHKRRRMLNERLRCYLGRTRIATLSRPLGDRPACTALGRCLWGCPTGALYTPSSTLSECMRYPNFEYVSGIRVLRFEAAEGRVRAIQGRPAEGGEDVRIPVGSLALAAGALSSSGIFLRSFEAAGRPTPVLTGLMDNRQVLVPFVNVSMIGRSYDPDSYQYHLIGMGVEGRSPKAYVHCQITTLKTALIHPVAQQLPLGIGAASRLTTLLHAALGVVNVNFHDTRRAENRVWLARREGEVDRLQMEYVAPNDEGDRMSDALRRVRRSLRALGCVAPASMAHVRPMGASVHYAGMIPMTDEERPLTARPDGRSRDFDNLYLVDGVTFPFLPAKNLTFTLMANAVRIARTI